MRAKLHQQMPLMPTPIFHTQVREIQAVSAILDDLEDVLPWVHQDLVRNVKSRRGRSGMTAEQVLRAMLIKQINGFSYAQLAFHLSDSQTYQNFCRLGFKDRPSKATLQRNIKALRPETLEKIHHRIAKQSLEYGIEKNERLRVDCTVVESNIHAPFDSSLLWDCVRVLTRLLKKAKTEVDVEFTNHKRRAKRRTIEILNAKRMEKRVGPYRELISITEKTAQSASQALQQLEGATHPTKATLVFAKKLRRHIDLAQRVINQARQRVLENKKVPSSEKVVSIFEPHTDIIVKDRRATLYGHKICLTTGESGVVFDCTIEQGNPNDTTLAAPMIRRHIELYGAAPKQVAMDGGFASKAGAEEIKSLGVRDVAFSKLCGLKLSDLVSNPKVYKALRHFRAGIEGTISFLKRVFGLYRCTWRTLASFKAYVHASVAASNLLLLARRTLT